MRALEGRLPVPTPEVQAAGELDGWGYVPMTRLRGEILSSAWFRVPLLARSLLHTEIMREHLLVEETRDGFRLSGLFDFEPAMVGAPEYELASVGVFFSAGDPTLLRTLLLAYGLGEDELSPNLSRRALAYALLHRYSNLSWYLTRVPPPPET